MFQAALVESWHFSFLSGFACRLKLVFFIKDLFSIDDAMLQNRAGLLVREVNCHPGQVLSFHKPREERQSYWNWASICEDFCVYLTIIPRARMGSELIGNEAEGLTGYLLRGYEGKRKNCFSKIQLVDQKKYRDKTSFAS